MKYFTVNFSITILNLYENIVWHIFNFIYFKAAFDITWRNLLWKMLLVIFGDSKRVIIVDKLYYNTELQL